MCLVRKRRHFVDCKYCTYLSMSILFRFLLSIEFYLDCVHQGSSVCHGQLASNCWAASSLCAVSTLTRASRVKLIWNRIIQVSSRTGLSISHWKGFNFITELIQIAWYCMLNCICLNNRWFEFVSSLSWVSLCPRRVDIWSKNGAVGKPWWKWHMSA